MSTTTVEPTYDRTARLYRLVIPTTGEILTDRDRSGVELAYLHAVAPQIEAKVRGIAERHPRLIQRALKAGLIVAAQGVQPGRGRVATRRPFNPTVWAAPEVAQVKGSGYREDAHGQVIGRDWYSVREGAEGGRECNCIDWAESAPEIVTTHGPAKLCKHIIATYLAGL